MGNRYGRNQKRAARAKIAAAERKAEYWAERREADAEWHRTEIELLRNELGRHRQSLSDVAKVLGSEFIGLTPEETVGRIHDRFEDPDDFYHLPELGNAPVMMRSLSMRTRTDNITRPQDQIHFLVSLAGHRSGYAISDTALLYAPHDVLARNIATQLAEHLVTEIKSALGNSK